MGVPCCCSSGLLLWRMGHFGSRLFGGAGQIHLGTSLIRAHHDPCARAMGSLSSHQTSAGDTMPVSEQCDPEPREQCDTPV